MIPHRVARLGAGVATSQLRPSPPTTTPLTTTPPTGARSTTTSPPVPRPSTGDTATGGPTAAALVRTIEERLVTEGGGGVALATRMAELQVPGMAVAVVRDGELVMSAGFGTTPEGDAAITADTLFQVGSVSKLVAATAAMSLVADGVVPFDTDLAPALTSWALPAGAQTADAPVSVAGILSHTAGFGVDGFLGYGPTDAVPDLPTILAGGGNTPAVVVEQAPGVAYRYSGGGYQVLEQAMVDATGQAFETVLAERVFGPAGMVSSGYRHPLPPELADRSTGGSLNGTAMANRAQLHPEHAAAGLWTTADDLGRLTAAFGRALAGADESLLPTGWARTMVTPAATADDGSTVGHGTLLDGPQPSWASHGGRNIGFCAETAIAVDGRAAAVVITNGFPGGSQLAREVLDTIAAAAAWPNWFS